MQSIPRIIENELIQALAVSGAVLIEGPRGSGKTHTGKQFSQSQVKLDTDRQALELAALNPKKLLEGETPRLIDEWQLAENIWNHVRESVDDSQLKGQFILTGSMHLQDNNTRHVGAARIMRITMRTLTLFESGNSTGEVSLSQIISGGEISGSSTLSLENIIELICRGGFPSYINADIKAVLQAMKSYLSDVIRADFAIATGQHKNTNRIERIIRSLARNVGSEISTEKLSRELSIQDSITIKAETLEIYFQVLRDLHIIEDLKPWAPHLRSSYVVRKSAKRYFSDPGLAVAALGATPQTLMNDLETLGFLFENLVVRDLRVYAQALGANVTHYRDSGGLEVDAIVQLDSNQWAAFEIKLNPNSIDEAVKKLLIFKKRIDTSKVGEPRILGVITGGKYSYMREDGIAVIAIGNLCP